MGEVYRAHDLRLRRDVAVKVLPAAFADDPERIERFRREARALAALDHPGIVTVHSVEEEQGVHFLTMQLVEGESLDRILAAGELPIERLLDLAGELAAAVAAAHAKGVVHRDLKPANIMVTAGGHVKVLDFGLASVARPEPDGATVSHLLTRRGEVLGTVPYMSPEQVAGRALDSRSDVFSLGIVLYELATGRRPFTGESSAEVMSAILRDTPVPPRQLRSALPAEVSDLVASCLRKAPEARLQSAREICEALSAARRGLASGAAAPAPAPPALSIVVLPFVNLSNDPENEYFSDGLTEEIITDLAKVKALRVISRTSAMRLKGADHDVRALGRSLDVRYVLEGSVRKAGSSLRIATQLIDAEQDVLLWSEKFSGTLDDVFEVQESVSRQIVRALDVRLSTDEHRRLSERPIVEIRAFELYLQARQELRRYAPDRAMELLRQAIAIEGETPPLLAQQTAAKVMQLRAGIGRDRGLLDEAEREALDLLARVPHAAYAHLLLGQVAYERGAMEEAVRQCRLVLAREPTDPDALFTLCTSYIGAGQSAQALEVGRHMVASDPLSPFSWVARGIPRWFLGEPELALPDVRRALELDPGNPIINWCAGYSCALAGDLAAAEHHARTLTQIAPNVPYTLQVLALVDALAGRQEAALARIADLDVAPLDAHHRFHLAESFVAAGDYERGLDLLDQAVDGGFDPFPFIARHCPFLEPVRSRPRFAALCERARSRCESFREPRLDGER